MNPTDTARALVMYFRFKELHEVIAEVVETNGKTTLEALKEALSVTDAKVERAIKATAEANGTIWPTVSEAFNQRIRSRMHIALTAAQGGSK